MVDQNPDTQKDIGRLEGKMDAVLTMVGDVKTDVGNLRSDFMEMEKGRLTRLELQFATHKTEYTVKARNTAAVVALVSSVITSVITALLIFYITGSM